MAFASPGVCHLPTTLREGPPQPAMAHSKIAKALIPNRALYRGRLDGMTIGILSSANITSGTHTLPTRLDIMKPFFASSDIVAVSLCCRHLAAMAQKRNE